MRSVLLTGIFLRMRATRNERILQVRALSLIRITDVYMKLIIIQKALDGLMPMTRTTVYSHL